MPLTKTNLIPSIAIMALLFSPLAISAQTGCPDNYAGGQAPNLINAKLKAKSRELCFSGYGLEHSGITRTPLWAGEYLTSDRVAAAKDLQRTDSFHPEPLLPADERAELEDYAHSGYDRGHTAPNGDMPDTDSQHESFSLANMTPQNPNNNRGLWSGIESSVREIATEKGAAYVVTGPLFIGQNLKRINGRVYVPTHYFKAVYIPSSREAGAYLVANAPGRSYKVVSINDLTKIAGIDPFPAIAAASKQATMKLPTPKKY